MGVAYPNNSGNINSGIGSISPLPGLMQPPINPLDMGKYEGNPNYEQDEDLIGFKPPMMQTADSRPYTYKGQNLTGSGTYIGALRKFLESQGKSDLLSGYDSDQVKLATGNPGLVERPGGEFRPPVRSIMPYLPVEGPEGRPYRPGTNPMPDMGGGGIGSITNPTNYDDKFSGYDTKIGGFDNQFKDIIGRLDKLEQGIGGVSSQPKSSPLDGGVFSVYQGNNSRGY